MGPVFCYYRLIRRRYCFAVLSCLAVVLILLLYPRPSLICRHTHAVRRQHVNHKKRETSFWSIALADLKRFLQFLYHFNQEGILHATVVKFTTSP